MKAIEFSSLTLECETRTLSNASGDQVILRPLPYEVLVYLLLKSSPASREELFEHCWGGAVVTDQALTNVISGLRRHFSNLKAEDVTLQTISKVGYFLDVQTTVVERVKEPVETEDLHQVHEVEKPTSRVTQSNEDLLSKPICYGLMSKVVALVLIALLVFVLVFEPFKATSPFTDNDDYELLSSGNPTYFLKDMSNGFIEIEALKEALNMRVTQRCQVDAYIRVFPSIYEPDIVAMTVRLQSKENDHNHVFQHFNVNKEHVVETILMAFDNPEVACDFS
ncbi:transcriptional regulator [Vibrio xuii]|nr:transcriptional regulator [Vibrio xuii]